MMMIDVDRFKKFNDVHGHDAGDTVLKAIAETLSATTAAIGADASYLARLGGEEFALLVVPATRDRAERLATEICNTVREKNCAYGGEVLTATVSIGIAMGAAAQSVEALLKAADTAVYQAKREGRDCWCMATPATIASGKGVSHMLRAHSRAA